MRAIDIYNFRRNLSQTNFQNSDTPPNIILELLDLKESIEFITSNWLRTNFYLIQNEKNKTLQS